ncbi:hypothetical protein [Novipirellula rosea]|uniref:hypothetical protein n=1 Tax=Novipirellula rosea TaxID=1031540 RepID=UPI0031ED0872
MLFFVIHSEPGLIVSSNDTDVLLCDGVISFVPLTLQSLTLIGRHMNIGQWILSIVSVVGCMSIGGFRKVQPSIRPGRSRKIIMRSRCTVRIAECPQCATSELRHKLGSAISHC